MGYLYLAEQFQKYNSTKKIPSFYGILQKRTVVDGHRAQCTNEFILLGGLADKNKLRRVTSEC